MSDQKHPIRIIQFGEGNFMRAFVDWMTDITNEKGLTHAGVAVVQPLSGGLCSMLEAQNNDYHVLLRGIENGQTVETLRKITAISKSLNPYEQFEDYLALAEIPEVRLVLSNTTEAGIAYDASVKPSDTPAASFPGKLTQLLYRRYTVFAGAPDKGLVMLPCELIDRNGDNLKNIVLRHAEEWGLGEGFTAWLTHSCVFLNSLVDRIVPGFPRNELDAIEQKFGVRDNLLVAAEPFHLWVIEGPQTLSEEFPFHKAGLNVVWTDNMKPYRERKVRILNGAHTMMVAAAYLSGRNAVGECMEDTAVRGFMETAVREEIVPTLDLSAKELADFSASVLERFANPFIYHELLSISLNSFSKWKTRVLPSVKTYIDRKASLPQRLTFSMAALIAFYRITRQADGSFTALRQGTAYPVKDDAPVLEALASLWEAHASGTDTASLVSSVLSRTDWWGEDLCALPGFAAQVSTDLAAILETGLPKALPG